jgi:hypothetical protein
MAQAQSAFDIAHGLDVKPTVVTFSHNQDKTARISAITSTIFTVTFNTAPSSGTDNIKIYWRASKTAFV